MKSLGNERREVENIKIDLREWGYEGVNGFELD